MLRILLLSAFMLPLPGCIQMRTKNSLVRVWGDKNTLNQPALILERTSANPYHPMEVERYRRRYGVLPAPILRSGYQVPPTPLRVYDEFPPIAPPQGMPAPKQPPEPLLLAPPVIPPEKPEYPERSTPEELPPPPAPLEEKPDHPLASESSSHELPDLITPSERSFLRAPGLIEPSAFPPSSSDESTVSPSVEFTGSISWETE